jgi:hypothetical protein
MTEIEWTGDVAELVAWAENYGHPEQWAKRAMAAHNRAENLVEERDRYRAALEAIVESTGKLAAFSIAHEALTR